MKRKIAIFVSIFAAVLMLLPGVASAYNISNGNRSYDLGTYNIKLAGNEVFVSSASNSVKESWQYYTIINGTINKQNLKVDNVTRVINCQNNLLSIQLSNKYLKADEIYYLNEKQLDTSIAVQNIFDGNETPIVSLDVQEFKAVRPFLFNLQGNKVSFSNNNILIANPRVSPYVGASLGPFFLSWNQAVGLMGPIGMISNQNGQAIDLTVLNTMLQENQTVSVNLGSNFQGINLDNSPGQSPFPFYNSPADIWSTNNQVVAQILQSANGPGGPVPSDTPQDVQLSSSLTGTSSYVVNQITESVSLTGTSTGYSQTANIELEDDYFQNYQNQEAALMTLVMNILTDGMNAFGIPLPNPFDLVLHSTSSNQQTDSYTIAHNAGSHTYDPYTCGRFGMGCYQVYGVLGTHYGFLGFSFKPSLTFGLYFRITNEYNIGGTTSSPAYNYYDYSVTYGITDSSTHTQFYEGTNNLYFNMVEST